MDSAAAIFEVTEDQRSSKHLIDFNGIEFIHYNQRFIGLSNQKFKNSQMENDLQVTPIQERRDKQPEINDFNQEIFEHAAPAPAICHTVSVIWPTATSPPPTNQNLQPAGETTSQFPVQLAHKSAQTRLTIFGSYHFKDGMYDLSGRRSFSN